VRRFPDSDSGTSPRACNMRGTFGP
jgi:hypothetical protein